MNLVILDFEQILQNEEYDSAFFSYLLDKNCVAIVSRTSINILETYVNVLNITKEKKSNLFLFPHRASMLFSYVGDKLHLIYESSLDKQTIAHVKKAINKTFLDFKFSVQTNNTICKGSEISIPFDKKQNLASSNLLMGLEVLSNELKEFEIKTSNYGLFVSKRCRNECACFSQIIKEIASKSDKCFFVCKSNDHKLEKNISVISLEQFKLFLENGDI
jgi:hypothetical protein